MAGKLIDVPGNRSYVVDIPASQLQIGTNTVRLVALASHNGFNVDAGDAVFTIPNQVPTAPATREVTTAEVTASAAVAIGAADLDGDTLSFSIKAGTEPQHGQVSFAMASSPTPPARTSAGPIPSPTSSTTGPRTAISPPSP